MEQAKRWFWPDKLHEAFVVAYEELVTEGKKASPKRVMDRMQSNGCDTSKLTVRQIQSHHQKFVQRREYEAASGMRALDEVSLSTSPAAAGGGEPPSDNEEGGIQKLAALAASQPPIPPRRVRSQRNSRQDVDDSKAAPPSATPAAGDYYPMAAHAPHLMLGAGFAGAPTAGVADADAAVYQQHVQQQQQQQWAAMAAAAKGRGSPANGGFMYMPALWDPRLAVPATAADMHHSRLSPLPPGFSPGLLPASPSLTPFLGPSSPALASPSLLAQHHQQPPANSGDLGNPASAAAGATAAANGSSGGGGSSLTTSGTSIGSAPGPTLRDSAIRELSLRDSGPHQNGSTPEPNRTAAGGQDGTSGGAQPGGSASASAGAPSETVVASSGESDASRSSSQPQQQQQHPSPQQQLLQMQQAAVQQMMQQQQQYLALHGMLPQPPPQPANGAAQPPVSTAPLQFPLVGLDGQPLPFPAAPRFVLPTVIIRRWGTKFGGKKIALPATLDELLATGGQLLKISAVKVRTCDEGAEIDEVQLIEPGSVVCLTTSADEESFASMS